MSDPSTGRPNSIPWPPLIYIAAATAAVLLHILWPIPWLAQPLATFAMLAGIVFIGTAFAIELAAALTFRRSKTTILPHRAATSLITTGPFALSRNPIYLANTMLVAGAGLAFGVAWLLPASLLAAFATHHLAILREERHLAASFGEDWTTYANATNRWLGRKSE